MYRQIQISSIPILKVAEILNIPINNYKALCFMHNEKTPSLYFYVDTNSFYCFGCQKGGNSIDLVMQVKKCDFKTALNWIKQQFKFSVLKKQKYDRKKIITLKVNDFKRQEKTVDFDTNEKVISLLSLDNRGFKYLTEERKITEEIIIKRNIKSINNIDEFYNLLKKNIEIDKLIKNGFYKIDRNTGELRKVWWNAGIVFPYYNYENRIQTLSLRSYTKEKKNRYFFLSARTCLFNENILSQLKANERLFICEGIIDALSLECRGLNSIAVSGISTFKMEWKNYVKGFNNIIIFDNEENAQIRAINLEKILNDQLINAEIRKIEKYKDINEMYVAEIIQGKEE